MKFKRLANLLVAAILSFSAVSAAAVQAAADNTNAVYVRTSAVPKEATEYAEDMFANISESEMRYLGLTASEAENAVLGAGFIAKQADGNVGADSVFYRYPVLCGGEMSAVMTVSHNDGGYGFQFGKDDMITSLGKVKTSPDDPAEVYVSESAFYAVTDSGAEVLSYGLSYNEKDIKREIAAVEKMRKNSGSPEAVVAVYGGKTGLVKSGGKLYCVKKDGSLASGWQTVGGKKYYFKKDFSAAVKSTNIGGIRYSFGSSGVCGGKYTGWVKSGENRYCYKDGEKIKGWFSASAIDINSSGIYYADKKSGAVMTGTAEIDGRKQSFSETGLWENTNTVTDSVCYSKLNREISKDDYGGVYIENGSTFVVMSVNGEKVGAVVDGMRDKYAQIEIRPCKFSVTQLESVKSELSRNVKKYGITGMYTDIINNRFVVEMKEKNSGLEKYLDTLDDRNIVRIYYGDLTVIED